MVSEDKSPVFDFSEMQEVLLWENQQIGNTVPIEMATRVPDLQTAIPYMEMYERERQIKIPYQPSQQGFHKRAFNNKQATQPGNNRQIEGSLDLPPKCKSWIQTTVEFLVVYWSMGKMYKFVVKAAKCLIILAVLVILRQFWLNSIRANSIAVEDHELRKARLRMMYEALGDLFGEGNVNDKC